MIIEKIKYGGWDNCYQVRNEQIDIVITGDVGPRIIRLGFLNNENVFCEVPELLGQTGGDDWRIYGGHRFWHAPEQQPRTYYPDNQSVEIFEEDDCVHVRQAVEPISNIQKELEIRISDNHAHVQVKHRLWNRGVWDVQLAPWALSVMAAGGVGILPLPERGSHEDNLLPSNPMTLWAYTDMSDERWTWGNKYILLRQDVKATYPQKIGVGVKDGWGAYLRNGLAFVKLFAYQEGGIYPDMNSTAEMFTNNFMLELETLAPLVNLAPSQSAEHVEDWFLFNDVPTLKNDEAIDKHLLPLVIQAKELVQA